MTTPAELINSLAPEPRRAAIEELLSRAMAAEKRVEELIAVGKRLNAVVVAQKDLISCAQRGIRDLDLLLDGFGSDESRP